MHYIIGVDPDTKVVRWLTASKNPPQQLYENEVEVSQALYEKIMGVGQGNQALFNNGEVSSQPIPEETDTEAYSIREDRDARLVEADILIFKAEDLGVDTTIYRAYRQALRDVPEQEGFPEQVSWPAKPPEPSKEAA